MSSLRDHYERVLAEKQAQAQQKNSTQLAPQAITQPITPVAGNDGGGLASKFPTPQASQLEIKFFNDWEQLSNIQSHEAKNAKKAELLPTYIPWIEGTIAGGVGTQDDMLLKLMVWCLDTHDFVNATNIAEFALLNDMVMPEPFSRSVATIYAEQMADEGLKNLDNIADYADIYKKAVELTNPHDMPDEVRAKLYRVWGNSVRDTHPADAELAYKRALQLNPKVGCSRDLKDLTKPQN